MKQNTELRTVLAMLAAMAGGAMLLACNVGASERAPASVAAAPDTPPDPRLAEGRAIAASQCAICHAIGPQGDSPRSDAPPLRHVLGRYNTASLEMDLMEGMRVGHADMPRFEFDPLTVDSLIIWLESIQTPRGR